MKQSTIYTFDCPAKLGLHPTSWFGGRGVSETFDRIGLRFWKQGGGYKPDTPASAWVSVHRAMAEEAKTMGNLIFLDLEVIPWKSPATGGVNLATAIECARAVRDVCPAIKIASYGGPFPWMGNRDWFIQYGQRIHHDSKNIRAVLNSFDEFYDLIDLVDIPGYLMGESVIERDFDWIRECRQEIIDLYPRCRPITSVWGRFHNAFDATPRPGTIPQDVLRKYASLVTRYGDAVAVFDVDPMRDDGFVKMLKGGA